MKTMLCVCVIMLALAGCAPRTAATPSAPATGVLPATQPAPLAMTETAPAVKTYANNLTGLTFQFPGNWYGPEEYYSDPILRVEIGSDVVYPYGTDPGQRNSTVKNSYAIVLQVQKYVPNQPLADMYQTVSGMRDSENRDGGRGRTIRVREIRQGRFTGYEFISTLSDTAQTEPVYARQVLLRDDRDNLISVMGNPNNVEVAGGDWRAVYAAVDQANQPVFEAVVASIRME